MSALLFSSADPWLLAEEADRRFNRLLTIGLLLLLALAIALRMFDLTGLQEGGGDNVESQFVSLIPDAEPAKQVEEPAPAPEDQKEPPQQEKPSEKPKQDKPPEPKTQEKPAEPTQQQKIQAARETAQRSGVLAMQQQLADLQSQSLSGFDSPQPLETITAQSGTGATGGSSATIERSAASGSGGIGASGTGETRRTQSGTGLGQRRTTTVESPVGFGQDKSKPGQGGTKLIAGRTLEEIQLTFDRNKGAFYAIFNRAMRENPGLGAGKIVVSLTIAPSGAVTACTLVSSTFNDPELERKIIQRVMLLNFGAKDVPSFTYPNYPINFLPS